MISLTKESIHIYLDDQMLKIAKIQSAGSRKTVAGIFAQEIKDLSQEDLAKVMIEAKRKLAIRTRKASIVLPAKCTITKSIEVPSLDEQEITDIIRLQAGRHTPYSKDEIIVGHINLEVVLERYMKSLLVIVSEDVIRNTTMALEAAGFQLESIHVSSEVLTQSAVRDLGLSEMDPAQALIHVDSTFSEFIVIRKQKPFFIRSIPIGLKQLSKASVTDRNRFLDEIKKSVEAYQSDESGAQPERFFVTSSDAHKLAELRDIVAASFKVTVDAVPQHENIPMTPQAQHQSAQIDSASFLDVVLDALHDSPFEMDLLPEDLKIQRNFRKRGQEVFVGGICLLIIFIMSMSTFLTKIYFRSSYLMRLQSSYEVKSYEVEDLVQFSEETRSIREFKNLKGRTLKVWSELATVLPREMYLKEFSLDEAEGKLSMTGTSELMSTVFAFVTELENHPDFQNVATEYTKSRKEGDRDVADFGITAFLEDEEGAHAG